MANYFVDSTTGDDGDNGSTMDLAFATLKYAIEADVLTPGDTLWVRRIHAENASNTITVPSTDGSPNSHIRVIGWPRALESSITGATWTQGSTTVDNITGLSMVRGQHLGRYVTAPNGGQYLITYIVDTDTIKIDKPYVGTTVTSANGAFTIQADDDYDEAQAIDDSGWTIKKTNYNADADNLPYVDFGANAYYLNISSAYFWQFKNQELIGGTSYGVVRIQSGFAPVILQGMILTQDQTNIPILREGQGAILIRCVLDGGGVSNRAVYYPSQILFIDCVIYNMANSTDIFSIPAGYGPIEAYGLNISVETGESVNVFSGSRNVQFIGKDVKWGGNGIWVAGISSPWNFNSYIKIENWGRVIGANKTWSAFGSNTKVDVVGGSGDPYKRTNGADSVIEIENNLNHTYCLKEFDLTGLSATPLPPVFTHEFEVNSVSKNYRYYVQAEAAIAADKLWLEVEYIHHYTGINRYMLKKLTSDESVSQRSGVNDWSQYIEVTDVQPDAPGISKVVIKCYCTYYSATAKIYIDPNPEIT